LVPRRPGGNTPEVFFPNATLNEPYQDEFGHNALFARSLGWLYPFIDPPVSGRRGIGRLTVAIPEGAQAGQHYKLQIDLPSATSDGRTDVPLVAGPGRDAERDDG
jgi:hypothetical protein